MLSSPAKWTPPFHYNTLLPNKAQRGIYITIHPVISFCLRYKLEKSSGISYSFGTPVAKSVANLVATLLETLVPEYSKYWLKF